MQNSCDRTTAMLGAEEGPLKLNGGWFIILKVPRNPWLSTFPVGD